MKCYNIPRYAAQEFKTAISPDKWAWISIGEPEKGFQHIQNQFLDKIPKLKISFYDLTEDILESETSVLKAPTLSEAHRIVRFIMDHPGKRFIVNCAAGISRSGAICQFLQTELNYEWDEFYKKFALPNKTLYSLLKEAHQQRLNKPKYNG